MLAFDALEEVERIDGLLSEYNAVTAAVRPRMEADALNSDYRRTIERLRYDPDAIPIQQRFTQEEMDNAFKNIMNRNWKQVDPPVS